MSDEGHPPFWQWFYNSMFIGVLTAVWTVFFCALGAFAFSRLRFRGRVGACCRCSWSRCSRSCWPWWRSSCS